MAASELLRALRTFGALFGPAPLVARRCARAPDRASARALVLRHVARVRRRAGVDLRVSGEEHVPARHPFVLVYNQTSLADDLGNLDVLWRHVDLSTVAAEYGYLPFFPAAAGRVGLVLVRRGGRWRSSTGRRPPVGQPVDDVVDPELVRLARGVTTSPKPAASRCQPIPARGTGSLHLGEGPSMLRCALPLRRGTVAGRGFRGGGSTSDRRPT